jgi:NAD(P)-dependent dehydrogenase (short-subunit alcohol dehydrogenase family)
MTSHTALITTPFGFEATAAEVINGISLAGKNAIVTGASSGIGVETARALAGAGAAVTLAVRDLTAGERVAEDIRAGTSNPAVDVRRLDLADLASVRGFTKAFDKPLHILVNNAGVMALPDRQLGSGGWEQQMATNHLGHFALTGLLLDRIVTTARARIVTVSSHLHRMGRLRPDDVAGAAFHSTWVSYGTSKLANLLFTAELSRRLELAGLPTLAVAAHPGWTRSNLAGSGAALGNSRVRRKLGRMAGSALGQSAAGGALPVLCAATSSSVDSGQYIGPAHLFGLLGPPKVARPSRRARDEESAAALWEASEELTAVRYSVDTSA